MMIGNRAPEIDPSPDASPTSAPPRGVLDWIDWVLNRIVAIAMLAVMGIIVCDVIGRYILGSPVPWVYDLVSIYFMNMILYLIASDTLRTGGHITLDLKVRLLPRPLWTALQAFAWFAVMATLALAGWKIAGGAVQAFLTNDVHPGYYDWPIWLEKGIVALGFLLLVLRIGTRLARFCISGFDPNCLSSDTRAVVSGEKIG